MFGKSFITGKTSVANTVIEAIGVQMTSSATVANGFGLGLNLYGETATNGTNQQMAQIAALWTDATNATRKAKLQLSAYDTAQRIGLEIEATGTSVKNTLFGDVYMTTLMALSFNDEPVFLNDDMVFL